MTKDNIQSQFSVKTVRGYFILAIILISFSSNLFAQTADKQEEVFVVADEMPSFEGGQKSLMETIYKNIVYPQDAIDDGIEGKVIIRFIINKEGKPTQITVSKGLSPSIDKVALAAVNKLPKFTPGKKGGNPVSVWYAIPINFKINK